jgi:hemerythrin
MSDRPTILAIDDDPVVTQYLESKLGASYRIITTNLPGKALELAKAEKPDLILVDVDMADVDGFEVCRRLKANGVAETPVVFLTGRTDSADEVRGFEAGGVDYIHKHLERDVLEARVRQQLTLHRVQAALRERLRQAMHNLRTTKVTTGVYWVQVPEAGLAILCGSPEDVVKHLMLRGYIQEETRPGAPCETGPNVILLSDLMLQNGRFANMAEFPVLQMLYRQGMILPDHPNNTGRKPIIVGSAEQVAAQLAYIYRGNYGLASIEELRAAGLDEQEAARHLAIKLGFAFGKIRPSEELLDFRVVGRGAVEIANGVTVRRVALNKFEIGYQGRATHVDLNLHPAECYEAPYTLGQHRIEPQYFGIVHSGEGDGWDVRRQCMGSIVMYQGRYYLVDAGPGIADTLKSLGIDVGEIEGIFHTHAHDDHFAGLPALLASGRRLKYFTTPLVRHSVTRKLSALLSIDEALFAELFDVRDLSSELWNDCDGMEVMPLPTPHPVENCLFVIRVRDDETYRTYAHWADIVSFDVLRRMLQNPPASEVLGDEYLDKVRNWYMTPATVKKIDSGGGLIHGEPLDFAEDTSDKIILAHRAGTFSPEQLEIGSNAVFGAVEVLIPSSQDYLRQRAAGHLARLFPDATPAELNGLLRSPIVDFNAGSIILRRHADARQVYLLLAGSVEQIVPALGSALAVATGSLIGAHALSGGGRAGNTWRAVSPVRAMKISVGAMRAFLRHGGQQERWRTLWEATAVLRGTALFGERIGLVEQERVARAMRSAQVAKGATLTPTDRSLCLVREGELKVKYAGGHEETVGAGGFLGEEGVLGTAPGAWTAKARTECTVEWIPAESLRRIPIVMWKLLESQDRRRCAIALAAG